MFFLREFSQEKAGYQFFWEIHGSEFVVIKKIYYVFDANMQIRPKYCQIETF